MSLSIILHTLEIKMPYSLRIFIHLFTEHSEKKQPPQWDCLLIIINFYRNFFGNRQMQ